MPGRVPGEQEVFRKWFYRLSPGTTCSPRACGKKEAVEPSARPSNINQHAISTPSTHGAPLSLCACDMGPGLSVLRAPGSGIAGLCTRSGAPGLAGPEGWGASGHCRGCWPGGVGTWENPVCPRGQWAPPDSEARPRSPCWRRGAHTPVFSTSPRFRQLLVKGAPKAGGEGLGTGIAQQVTSEEEVSERGVE